MFSRQRYVRDLLEFAERRISDADGNAITRDQLAAVFQQPFAQLVEEDNREAAEQPVHQVRIAVEVLRHLLDDEIPAVEEYCDTAFNSLLAQWGLSYSELQEANAALQDNGEKETEANEIIDSVAERLRIAAKQVEELLIAPEDLTEEKLEELFGLPSTRRDPFTVPDEPQLLRWQLDQLPDSEGKSSEDEENRKQAEKTLKQTMRASVTVAEAEALPKLRDILVSAIEDEFDGRDSGDIVDSLTQRLALDFGNSGQIKTTRLRQASETLQTVIFGLRTKWFMQRQKFSVFSDTHPVTGWKIAFDEDNYTQKDFDEDWNWLERYETWRSAMQTLIYPDSALLPSLLEESSPHHKPSKAFSTLISRLRTTSQLTPRKARELANGDPRRDDDSGYLTMLKKDKDEFDDKDDEFDSFVITEQLTEEELLSRKKEVKRHFSEEGLIADEEEDQPERRSWLHEVPNWLKEIYYFVPLTLAIHLQRGGHFLSALAWYRTIYAYDWETEQRKIFYGLVFEENLSLQVGRNPENWLREKLNPHDIASQRRHAYTRFTLQSIIGCFLDFADAEFSAATDASTARARSLYLTALDLLQLPEMLPPEDERATGNPLTSDGPAPESSAISALRQHAELSLDKLRSGRNIAGMEQAHQAEREAESAAAPFHRSVVATPTIYRYRILIERAKKLVNIAQQVEASFLSSAEKADDEAYNLLQARQDLALSEEQVKLQDLRVDETDTGIELAGLQQQNAIIRRETYEIWIDEGPIEHEQEMINSYREAGEAQKEAANWSSVFAGAQRAQSMGQLGSTAGSKFGPVGAVVGAVVGVSAGIFGTERENSAQKKAIDATTSSQVASVKGNFERRKQQWRLQHGLARKDEQIGQKQIEMVWQQRDIAVQERSIAELRTNHAANTLDFLANKFTNAELYEWMSGVLNRVYRFFLQQATAIALLAQKQLAFERQEKLPGFIRQDYWQPAPETESDTGTDSPEPDRRGLTGSARLLQDIYKLDQFAFKTRERKLQLSQTFSLARLFPFEFEKFRQTGRLPFATPMELFDRGFPGHYMRLIKRISVSVMALVPPTEGIRATLTSSGISRVVIGPDVFRTIEIQRSPELIAFTSPVNATGLFQMESEAEGELLLPFEGQGVDTTWQLEMPHAANAFDFRTIADVLLTIDYTAQYSASYRHQVIDHLDRNMEGERPFHFRHEFADQWYDLHNPDPSDASITVRFETRRSDFPPHIEDLRIEHLLLVFARTNDAEFEVPVESLRFTDTNDNTSEAGGTETTEGIISTRRASGAGWKAALRDLPPLGEWELTLPNTEKVRNRFAEEEIEDIMFVITFKGETPEWPM